MYRVEWTPERIDYFVDDERYFSRTQAEVNLPSDPMYIIFNQGVFSLPGVLSGKGWSDGEQVVFEVE